MHEFNTATVDCKHSRDCLISLILDLKGVLFWSCGLTFSWIFLLLRVQEAMHLYCMPQKKVVGYSSQCFGGIFSGLEDGTRFCAQSSELSEPVGMVFAEPSIVRRILASL